MKIVWDKSHEIGINLIDHQHKHFFEITNMVLDLGHTKHVDEEKLMVSIYQLAGYALFHFSVEEHYFKRYGYPGAKSQIKAHQAYREKIGELMRKMENPRTNLNRLAEEMADFSVRWLTRHLLTEDRRYAVWFKKKRRKNLDAKRRSA